MLTSDEEFKESLPKYRADAQWYFITWNNPPQDWKEALAKLNADYHTGQLEQGQNGTKHIQALLYWQVPVGSKFWRGKPIWSKGLRCRDAVRVHRYVQKERTRLEGPIEVGKPPNQFKQSQAEKRSDDKLTTAFNLAKEGRIEEIEPAIQIRYWQNLWRICSHYAEPNKTEQPRGCWIYGPPGCGKSYFSREITEESEVFSKGQSKWFDGYRGKKLILIDDLDQLGSGLSHYIKIWTDPYAITGEVKGAGCALRHEKFVVTSNYLPHHIWPSPEVYLAVARRFMFMVPAGRYIFICGTDFGIVPRIRNYAVELKKYTDQFMSSIKLGNFVDL